MVQLKNGMSLLSRLQGWFGTSLDLKMLEHYKDEMFNRETMKWDVSSVRIFDSMFC